MSYAAMFRETPAQWGLRGDPFLWDALGWHLAERSNGRFPEDPDVVEAAIWTGLSDLSGVDFERQQNPIGLGWLPKGGMSGGAVDPEYWRKKLVPMLVARAGNQSSRIFGDIDYHPAEHRFRFAAWAAATAARSSRRVCSFSVEQGARLLRVTALKYLALGPHWLPDAEHFYDVHHNWCSALLQHDGRPVGMTYGIAAKLVNVYTKALFLPEFGGGWFHPYLAEPANRDYAKRCEVLHPPVDRVLLNELAKKDVGGFGRDWIRFRDRRWSRFDADDYREVISLMKRVTGNRPWRIEAFWQGFQS